MTKPIIEINGVKLEVDMSTARRIDEYKIGDNVKVLQKEYSGYSVLPGVIVEFVNFKELPTIIIALLKQSYSGTELLFINYNKDTKGVEITPCSEHELKLEKNSVLDKMNQEIEKKQNEIDELTAKKNYFNKYFNKYFSN